MDDADLSPELKIVLRKAVVFATISYDTIVLREPTGAEWEQWDHLSGAAATMKAISVIAGLPEGAVKQIGVRDLNAASKYLGRFF